MSRVRAKSKKAAHALMERQRKLKNSSDLAAPCQGCVAYKEQLRVAHVTIRFLQERMMKMASNIVA